MARITPQEAAGRIEGWLRSLVEQFETGPLGKRIFARWRARSVQDYHRNAKAEIGTRRDPADTGPLRILSGTLAGGVGSGGPNRPGVIERVSGTPARVRLEKGVDLGRVPYARIHELGGVAGRGAVIPARSYLRPALHDELPEVRGDIRRTLTRSFREAVLRA
jgi:hypothetical protein